MVNLRVNSISNVSSTEIINRGSNDDQKHSEIDITHKNKDTFDTETTDEKGAQQPTTEKDATNTKQERMQSDLEFETVLSDARRIGLIKINLFGGILSLAVIVLIIVLFSANDSFIISFGVSFAFFSMQTLLLVSVTYWYYIQEKLQQQANHKHQLQLFFLLRLIKEKFGILLPMITQFADVASDIGVMIDFYYQSQNSSQDAYFVTELIDYYLLFLTTLGILILYRIVSSVVIYFFSKSITDAILQFVDLYIFKIIRIS